MTKKSGTTSTDEAITPIADGIYALALGSGPLRTNVYIVASGPSWALVDTAWPASASQIVRAAESLLGQKTRPAAILLTHIHPDHAGAVRELATLWNVGVYVHPAELPLAAGGILPRYANPLDRWLLAPMMRLQPARSRACLISASDISAVVRPLDPASDIPGLPGWRSVPSPGHTPGHVAFFRPGDAVLISGDAILTVDVNSIGGLLRRSPRVSGPPRYTTWNWAAAAASIDELARLRPRVLAPGHGPALSHGAAGDVRALAEQLNRRRSAARLPAAGRPHGAGLLVNTASRRPALRITDKPDRSTDRRP
jgi:glyoxylase-like metal-dependent hydrolase (beta-lactamase superfamily II)